MAGLAITESDHYWSKMIGLGSGAAVETFPVIYIVSSRFQLLLPALEGSLHIQTSSCMVAIYCTINLISQLRSFIYLFVAIASVTYCNALITYCMLNMESTTKSGVIIMWCFQIQ